MYKVSVIEDSGKDRSILKEYLSIYSKERKIDFSVEVYTDVELFLTNYKSDSDIVFMDIELPGMDGMRGAHKLRELDTKVILIFVTNMVQYAVKGYEVDALDYIVKPYAYKNFCIKLDKAIRYIEREDDNYITIMYERCFRKISLRDLLYVEVRSHRLYYHLTDGTQVDVRGTIAGIEEKLLGKGFVRCNNCYLVNMRHIKEVLSDSINVGSENLIISRNRRKNVVETYSAYLEQNTKP